MSIWSLHIATCQPAERESGGAGEMRIKVLWNMRSFQELSTDFSCILPLIVSIHLWAGEPLMGGIMKTSAVKEARSCRVDGSLSKAATTL